MDINSSIAAGKYLRDRAATEATPVAGEAPSLMSYARDFAETLRAAEDTAQKAMMGQADPHSLVEALAQTQLAVETAVTVRDKVVEAYQEILRMPV